MQREWLWALSAAVAGVLLWLARRRRSRSAVSEPSWEARLEEQVQRLGERESDLEQQVERLSRHEDALERQVSALALQEGHLEEQVQGIGEREKSMQLTIDDLGRRESRLEGEVAALRGRESELEGEIAQLQGRESELETVVEDLRERESRLESDVREASAEWLQADERVKRYEADLQRERSLIEHLQQRVSVLEARESRPDVHWSSVLSPSSFSELPKKTRRYMLQLAIPEGAMQQAELLDSDSARDAWLRSAWRGLGALNEYAATEHDCAGSFWKWCKESDSPHGWLPERLAMRETDITMKLHGEKRIFPVDEQVNPSGRIEMQAHLKVDTIGNQSIPRIHFHDDTQGTTGRVHIGFIGPHSLTPTSNF